MKFGIIFVGLFSLLIANAVSAQELKEIPKTCEDFFQVAKCNDCQATIWDSWGSSSTCGFSVHLLVNILKEYTDAVVNNRLDHLDMTPYNEAVKKTCDAKFSCKYKEAESIWKGVEEKCANELQTHIDWSANPTSIDRTVSSAYGTILFFYFGIPDHDSFCLESSSGELCGIEGFKPFFNWLKEKFPKGKFKVSPDHKFVYGEDGSRHEVPKELYSCGECPEKMMKFYRNWPDKHPLPDYLVKNIFGSWEEVDKYYTCPNNHHTKGKLRRSPVRRLTDNSNSAGLSNFLRFMF